MENDTRRIGFDDPGSIHIKDGPLAADWTPEVVLILWENIPPMVDLRSRFHLLGCDGEIWTCARDNMPSTFGWIG